MPDDATQVVLEIALAETDDFARIIEFNYLLNTGNGLTSEDLALPQPSQDRARPGWALLRARLPLRATAAQVIAVAQRQVGVYESPAGSNNVLFDRWYGLIGPWCAMFMSWCFAQAGSPLGISTAKGFAYCPAGVDYFKANGRWSSRPSVGALVFYQWAGQSRPCHVGIVYQVDADGTIWTIEGNTSTGTAGSQSNGGIVARRHRTTTYVVGYGLPDYTQPAPPLQRDRFLYLKQPPFVGLDVKGVRRALRIAGNTHLNGDSYAYTQDVADVVNLFNARHHIMDPKDKTKVARGVVPDTWPALRKIPGVH